MANPANTETEIEEEDFLDYQFKLLREVVTAACPEVRGNGIFETDHADMIPWEKMQPPYAVIAMGKVSQSDEYSEHIQQDVFEVPVDIYYLALVEGPLSPVRKGLWRIAKKFNVWDEEKIKVLSVGELEWGEDVPANHYFASKGQKHRVGRITVRILIAAPFDTIE